MRYYPVLLLLVTGCSSVTVREYNDFLSTALLPGGTSDNNFSQSLSISHNIKGDKAPEWLKSTASTLPNFNGMTREELFSNPDEIGIEVGQSIYTPDDLSRKDLIEDDNPYAGYLYTQLSRTDVAERQRLTTGFEVGLVGPNAYGEQVQSWFHELCGCTHPEGWDNQLHQELGLTLSHKREFMTRDIQLSDSFNFNVIDTTIFNLGNIHTDTRVQREFRLGYKTPHFVDDPRQFSCFIFSGLGGAVVLRNIFYDGNTFVDSHSVNKEYLVAEGRSGVAFTYDGWGLRIYWVFRSKEFEEERDELNSFGIISIGKEFSVEEGNS